MYFSGMKIDSKYAFFLIHVFMSFPNFVNMTKNTPFFPIFHVLHPLTMYVRTLPGPEKQPLLREFFYEDDI